MVLGHNCSRQVSGVSFTQFNLKTFSQLPDSMAACTVVKCFEQLYSAWQPKRSAPANNQTLAILKV